MTLSAKDRVEIALSINAELNELGCKCERPTAADIKGCGDRAYAATGHADDCPAVAHYRKPENQR